MFAIIAGVLLAPKVLELANRVCEEYLIPRRTLKEAAANDKVALYPRDFSVALTKNQMERLNEMGATSILSAGVHTRYYVEEAIRKAQEQAAAAAAAAGAAA